MHFLLPLIWGCIIGFVIIMYVVLDGFDLGIGILFPWVQDMHQRDIMMTTVSPVWDGNETWMVLGGACLYGAFPLAYSTLLPVFYLPIMLMLAALIFRGIAFEFRFKAQRSRFLWSIAFAGGSIIAAFAQGIILGTFLQGFANEGDNFTPYSSPWFSPFSLMAGVAVVTGYALLGATWLIAKTEGDLQAKMYDAALWCLGGVTIFLVIVSLWTPFLDPHIKMRWFSLPNFFYLVPLPIVTGLVVLYNWYCLRKKYEYWPFFLSIAMFLLSYIGLIISIWPYIIPHRISIWEASSPPSSQLFILVGVIILLPILLSYTAYSYRVFWGKVTKPEEY